VGGVVFRDWGAAKSSLSRDLSARSNVGPGVRGRGRGVTKCAQFRFIEAPKLCIERPVARKLAGGVGAPTCGATPLGDAPRLLAHFDLESLDESPSLDDLRGGGVLDLACAAVVE
jgi:hypothetical protein